MSMYRQNQAQIPEHQYPQMDWQRYFFPKPVPRGSIITCLVGALFLAIGISLQNIVLIASGCLLLLIGASIIGVIIRSNPTDRHYDQWVHKQAQAMLPTALAKFNMRRNQVTDQILRTHSFVLPGSHGASHYPEREVQAKRGKDGQWRFSINVYTYFLPAEHYLAVYTCDVNAFDPSSHIEQTEEYFYSDIVGVTTHPLRDTAIIGNRQYRYRIEQFSLRISNGDTIDLGASLKATPLDDGQDIPVFSLPHTGFDRTLTMLRRLLRSKKI